MTDQPTRTISPTTATPTGANTVLATASQAAATAIDTVIDTAQAAPRRTAQGIDGNPLAVLAGGIAVGVLAGAMLPRTDRENELLGPVGKRLTEGAAAAARAARDAGTAELMAAGISREAARAQVGKLIDGVMTAVKTAGDAATTAAKSPATKD